MRRTAVSPEQWSPAWNCGASGTRLELHHGRLLGLHLSLAPSWISGRLPYHVPHPALSGKASASLLAPKSQTPDRRQTPMGFRREMHTDYLSYESYPDTSHYKIVLQFPSANTSLSYIIMYMMWNFDKAHVWCILQLKKDQDEMYVYIDRGRLSLRIIGGKMAEFVETNVLYIRLWWRSVHFVVVSWEWG